MKLDQEPGLMFRFSPQVDPFPEYNDYFSGDVQIHPVLNLPEPKRRFVRSKWEEKKYVAPRMLSVQSVPNCFL